MSPKEAAYEKVAALVERFGEQIESYKKSDYNETLTRKDFIDPFFAALGWDMNNSKGNAQAYREVIHEDKLLIDGSSKAPDYSFKLEGGKRLFFVEAKKPSVFIKDAIHPAFQIRRYGWNAKLPISILTDFEEFAVYDCTRKPRSTDPASKARIKYILYSDYLEEFDFLWNTFSKEHVLKGSFDKFIEETGNRKGVETLDKEFLLSLDTWRTQLATNISINNKQLDEDAINFVVQQIIDRIIFLRIAEARSIEPENLLNSTIKQGDYYHNLYQVFRIADDRYNAGLFDFKKDTISRDLKIDNKVIKSIITELTDRHSPYEFSIMPIEIIGTAYEQFLGKQIKLDKNHRATIEEKPEVRKAGGVYYTPQYIVDYIVENTVGKLIKGQTPAEISKIKIVDPACGSGSFLLGAYQHLLDYHRNYYQPEFDKLNHIAADTKLTTKERNAAIRERNKLPITPAGELKSSLKKEILLNNIYGVDIDINAVEVTKLSLLLKCMEGETTASIQSLSFNERVLPTLDNNIKNGNSLIDLDIYDELDFGEEKKIKPFNWKKAFPNVDGFDCVIGNPPYFGIRSLDKMVVKYFETHYDEVHTGYNDIMSYFVYKAISLLKSNGVCGMITSNYYLGNKYAEPLRKFLTKHLVRIINFKNYFVFNGVSIHTSIILLEKDNSSKKVFFYEPETNDININNLQESFRRLEINKSELGNTWVVGLRNELTLIEKLKTHTPLGKISIIEKGSTSGKNNVFTVSKEFAAKREFETEILRKNVKNGDIGKYSIFERGQYLIYVDSNTDIRKYPNIYKYLEENKEELSNRNEVKKNMYEWFRLERPRKKVLFDSQEKIIVPYRAESNKFAYDNSQYFNDGGDIRAIVINENMALLGILWVNDYSGILTKI